MQIDNYADFIGHLKINFSYNLLLNDGAIVSNFRKEWVPTEKREWNLEWSWLFGKNQMKTIQVAPLEDVDAHTRGRIGPL